MRLYKEGEKREAVQGARVKGGCTRRKSKEGCERREREKRP